MLISSTPIHRKFSIMEKQKLGSEYQYFRVFLVIYRYCTKIEKDLSKNVSSDETLSIPICY